MNLEESQREAAPRGPGGDGVCVGEGLAELSLVRWPDPEVLKATLHRLR